MRYECLAAFRKQIHTIFKTFNVIFNKNVNNHDFSRELRISTFNRDFSVFSGLWQLWVVPTSCQNPWFVCSPDIWFVRARNAGKYHVTFVKNSKQRNVVLLDSRSKRNAQDSRVVVPKPGEVWRGARLFHCRDINKSRLPQLLKCLAPFFLNVFFLNQNVWKKLQTI